MLSDGFVTFSKSGNRWRDMLARADRLEMRIVRLLVSMTRFRLIQSVTLATNFLANGWVYAPIFAGIFLSRAANAGTILITAVLATAAAHALYAVIKRGIARRRPFEKYPDLHSLGRVLDRYSFPSGHCMTLTTVLVPIVHSLPEFWPGAIATLCMLAWCRLAAAHHYLSDVLAGISLGAAVAIPFSAWLLPA